MRPLLLVTTILIACAGCASNRSGNADWEVVPLNDSTAYNAILVNKSNGETWIRDGGAWQPMQKEAGSQTKESAVSAKERAMELAKTGWRMYQNGRFAGEFFDGQLTDPDSSTSYPAFWSNGAVVRVDTDSNEHREHIFKIGPNGLQYVGRVGADDRFDETEDGYSSLLDQVVPAGW